MTAGLRLKEKHRNVYFSDNLTQEKQQSQRKIGTCVQSTTQQEYPLPPPGDASSLDKSSTTLQRAHKLQQTPSKVRTPSYWQLLEIQSRASVEGISYWHTIDFATELPKFAMSVSSGK